MAQLRSRPTRPAGHGPWGLALLLLLTTACAAQSRPEPDSSAQANNSAPQLAQRAAIVQAIPDGEVLLDVVVDDAAGHPVSGLQAGQFSLTDDGRPVRNVSFSAMRGPTAQAGIVFVIDALAMDLFEIDRAKRQIAAFLKMSGGELSHPVSIVSLEKTLNKSQKTEAAMFRPLSGNHAFLRLIPYSRDGKALTAALDKMQIFPTPLLQSQGSEGLSTQMQLSLEAVGLIADAESRVPGRKLVIWLGPGWSVPGTADNRSQAQVSKWVAYLTGALERARITLYGVNTLGVVAVAPQSTSNAPSQATPGQGAPLTSPVFAAPITSETVHSDQDVTSSGEMRHPTYAQLTLPALAASSGGMVLYGSNDVTAEIQHCIRDADSSYALSYFPKPTTAGDSFHSVRVHVAEPGTVARTRSGYFAEAAPASGGQ